MIVTVGGNIGCGKSTLLKALDKTHIVIQEPVDRWGSWLDLFYSDMKRYGFGFQMKILYEFLDPPIDKNIITERSPLDALYVFGKNMLNNDLLTFMEYNLFHDFVHKIGWSPNVFIYLRADPQVCFDRIRKRSRQAENGVTLEYIGQIHNMYEQFIDKLSQMGVTVYVVNANFETGEVQAAVNELLKSISF